jgi:Cys-rich repeat protein
MRASNGRSRAATLAVLALAASFSVFRCTGGVSCLRDTDCPSGNICQAGACALPPVEPSDAGSDAPHDAANEAGPDSGRGGGDAGGAAGAPSGAAGESGAPAQ